MNKPVAQDGAFLQDVFQACGSRSNDLHVWWLGQSGFLAGWKQRTLAFDPYLSDSLTRKYASTDKPHVRMTEAVIWPQALALTNLKVVTASHHHTDHLDPDTLQPLLREAPWVTLVAPEAHRRLAAERAGIETVKLVGMRDGDRCHIDGFDIAAIPSAHEQVETDSNGNHLYLGYLVQAGPYVVYHSGDTVLYDGMVERLRPFNIDIALLPINGRSPERRVAGNLNGSEAAWLAKEIGARMVIPCHYEMFEFNTASPHEFVAECERLGQPYRVLRAGERFSSSEIPGITAKGAT